MVKHGLVQLLGQGFGFAPLTRFEQEVLGDGTQGAAVVLPDLPGSISAANCPAARHAFPAGMLVQGATATYLIEKLLHYKTSDLSMQSHDAAWAILDGGDKKLDDWKRDAIDRLHCLADEFSYDLADAARRVFGEGLDCAGFTKRKVLMLRRAQAQLN